LQGYSTFMDKHDLPPYAINNIYFRAPKQQGATILGAWSTCALI
jgi:hypothetical protein